MGSPVPKAFVLLAGRSLLERSIRTLTSVQAVQLVQPVVARDALSRYAALTVDDPKIAAPVPGGEERQDSVLAGLRALPPTVEWVAVHDAARCLVTVGEVEAVLAGARDTGAAILACPASDTIKVVRDGFVEESPPRHVCWIAQTPQVFRRRLLQEAVEKAVAEGFSGTDDAQLVARLGIRVRVVQGQPSNLKITEPSDLATARAWLERGEDASRSGAEDGR